MRKGRMGERKMKRENLIVQRSALVRWPWITAIALATLLAQGCGDEESTTPAPAESLELLSEEPNEQETETGLADQTDEADQTAGRRFGGVELNMPADVIIANPNESARRSAFFGDLHVHTDYSFDAYAFGTVATPYDAYRYAQGYGIKHPAGFEVKLEQPLDFYAITDHAMFLGAVKAAADTRTPFSRLAHVQDLHDLKRYQQPKLRKPASSSDCFLHFLTRHIGGHRSRRDQ